MRLVGLKRPRLVLDMLTATDPMIALEKACGTDALNSARRAEQDKIYKEAVKQAEL